MRAPLWAGLATCVVMAGCGGGDSRSAPASSAPTFVVPSGVTLTQAGTTIDIEETATVVVPLGAARSAVDITVEKVRRGSIDDLDSFGLPDEQRSSTPYYVDLRVENRGPAGLGGSTLPVLLRTDDDQRLGANEINGDLDECQPSTLPQQFLRGAEADLCLVYLLPKGQKVDTIDLQPGSAADAVRVRP